MENVKNRNEDQEECSQLQNELLIRSLNYHGQQLTSLIKDDPIFRELNLKNVDYHLYQSRCSELRMEDRGYRLDLHRFIASNMNQIFKHRQKENTVDEQTINQDNLNNIKTKESIVDQQCKDTALSKNCDHLISANMPPYESFASNIIDKEDRLRHVFEILSVGDVIYCSVAALNTSGLLLNLCCFAGINVDQHLPQKNKKSRYMKDLKIRCFCPADELIGASETQERGKGRVKSYQIDDLVCVVILEVKKDVQRLLVTMKSNSLQEPDNAEHICRAVGIRLGLADKGIHDLPISYQKTVQAVEKKDQYDNILVQSKGFNNPTTVEALADEIGLSNLAGKSTLMSNIYPLPAGSYAKQLRKRQNANASFHHVARGVKHFKAGENSEAFQCLNAALRIDEENVEGLVARGALYANNGSLPKAIADFEAALKIKSTHKNAQKYLLETLMAMAQNYEEDNSLSLASDTYTKILFQKPDHFGARKELCRVMIKRGQQSEKDRNFEEAVVSYSKALNATQGNKEARCRLLSLKMRYEGTSIDHAISKILESSKEESGNGEKMDIEDDNSINYKSPGKEENVCFDKQQNQRYKENDPTPVKTEPIKRRRNDSPSKLSVKRYRRSRSPSTSASDTNANSANIKFETFDEYKHRKDSKISTREPMENTKSESNVGLTSNDIKKETNGSFSSRECQNENTSSYQSTKVVSQENTRIIEGSDSKMEPNGDMEPISTVCDDIAAPQSLMCPKEIRPFMPPLVYPFPPPILPQSTKSIEDLEYDKAVESFLKTTSEGLKNRQTINNSRKYYDENGRRIYHPEDPRYKLSDRKIDEPKYELDQNKRYVANSLQKGRKSSGNYDVPLTSPSEYEKNIVKTDTTIEVKKENSNSGLSNKSSTDRVTSSPSKQLEKCSPKEIHSQVLDEIGKMSEQMNLDDLAQRLDRHFKENDTVEENLSSNIGTPVNEEQRDLMLDKVLATCSRVEQRLSEKRKVIENISSEDSKANHVKVGNLIEERRVVRRISESPPGKKEFRKSITVKEKEEPVYHTKTTDELDSQRCRPRRSTSHKDSSPRRDSDRRPSSSRKSKEPWDDSKHSRSTSKTSPYNHYTNKSYRQHFEGNTAEARKNSKERKYENSQKEELILALSQSHDKQISPPRRHIPNNERRKSSHRPESSRQSSETNKNRPTYDYRSEKPRSYNSSRSDRGFQDKRPNSEIGESRKEYGNRVSASLESSLSNKSANLTVEKILPGASTLEDINKYINAAKKEKLEQLKKKLPSKR